MKEWNVGDGDKRLKISKIRVYDWFSNNITMGDNKNARGLTAYYNYCL